MRFLRLRQANNGLSLVAVLLGLYMIAMPWLPNAELWWDRAFGATPDFASNLELGEDDDGAAETAKNAIFPDTNRIVIPGISLDSEIFTGPTTSALNKGPWQRPNTATPDEGGNTVIAGHRYAYGIDGKWVFYHLDKVKNGDTIGVYWEGEEFIYRVKEIKVVPPTAIEIEGPTDTNQLTLYTCTPLWTAKDRLVVVADLIERNSPDVIKDEEV